MVEPSQLQRYSLFGGLLEDQIAQILPLMEHESFKTADVILAEGAVNGRISFILQGTVAVCKQGLILTEFNEGDFFGEMEVLDVMPSAATIQAMSDVELISISNKALREFYKKDIKAYALFIMNLARDLSRRLRRMDDKAVQESPMMDWN